MTRGEYLAKLIKESGYNIMAFSKESGVPYTTLRSMIQRNLLNASIDNVIKVCKTLGISTDELAEYDQNHDAIREPKPQYEVKTSRSISLPFYGCVSAGSLSKIEGVTPEEVEHIGLPSRLLGKHAGSKGLYALNVNGESMNKIIPNGSVIVIKRMDILELKEGDIVIYSHDGDYSLKRFDKNEDAGEFIFRPESNDKRYHDIVIPFNTESDLKIHGKVITYTVSLD